MSEVTIWAASAFASAPASYLLLAFVNGSRNPQRWPENDRVFLVFLWFFATLMIGSFPGLR